MTQKGRTGQQVIGERSGGVSGSAAVTGVGAGPKSMFQVEYAGTVSASYYLAKNRVLRVKLLVK